MQPKPKSIDIAHKKRFLQLYFQISYESCSKPGLSIEDVNIPEKENFMNGQKYAVILSAASQEGISLHYTRPLVSALENVLFQTKLAEKRRFRVGCCKSSGEYAFS
ncbi:hypothetical protein DAPPUDRAFT_269480 [Daphnia pulex]|uniref:Strawberry notch helicase C domain-containing protein n=1 Tax=Daphnia pulex TaxID=6669 RepID=E9HZD1_DAPPU|nr:hypothetical protein DAPPUDRAFT_269480 [Daphnia pulex]|eukprot:EFX62901.1 hypothetical protein DAPPUDRAFT_269480 [Daphnia pulex]